MARKKKTETTVEEVKGDNGHADTLPGITPEPAQPKRGDKTRAMDAALEAGKEAPSDAVVWIKTNFNLDVSPSAFSVHKGKKKAKGAVTTSQPKWQPTSEPTLSELLSVRALAERNGGVASVLSMLEEVEAIVNEAGGDMGRLKTCLDFWDKASK